MIHDNLTILDVDYRPSMDNDEMKKKTIETQNVSLKRKFSDDEMTTFRDQFCKVHTEIKMEDMDFDSLKAKHKRIVDSLEEKANSLLANIEQGYEFIQVKCNLIPDFESNKMNFYDENGKYIMNRDMLPEERQLKMEFDESQKQLEEAGQSVQGED